MMTTGRRARRNDEVSVLRILCFIERTWRGTDRCEIVTLRSVHQQRLWDRSSEMYYSCSLLLFQLVKPSAIARPHCYELYQDRART